MRVKRTASTHRNQLDRQQSYIYAEHDFDRIMVTEDRLAGRVLANNGSLILTYQIAAWSLLLFIAAT